MNENNQNKARRSSIKMHQDGKDTASEHRVMWDWKSLEEQDIERKNNPRKKIDEPKTPYLPYEEEDDEYLKKLNEINKTKPTVNINNDTL